MQKIAIIGAGITGLTAAYYLKKNTIDVTVFEKQNHIGGVIKSPCEKGFIYETGPNSGIVSNAEIVDLFDELKDLCTVETADKSSARRLIWKNGKWNALPSGLVSAVTTPLFTLTDKFRILGEPFRKKGNDPHETLASLVLRRMGKSFLNYAIDPFILGIYAGDPAYLVPKYALPKLYNLEQTYGSFIKGAIKKAKIPKTDNEKKATREIFSVKGGLENFPKALAEKIGKENFRLNQDNISVKKNSGKYEINNEVYDAIISTGTANELDTLFPFLEENHLQHIQNLQYAEVAEITLGFDKWTGIELNAFGGLVPFKENKNILGVLFMSTLFKNRCPEGGAWITIFTGGTRKPHLAAMSDKELKDVVKKDVMEMMGLKEFNPVLFKLTRYKRAIAQYGADSEKRLESIKNLENTHKGLFLAGSIRDGVGIADRIKQGKQIAEQIMNS